MMMLLLLLQLVNPTIEPTHYDGFEVRFVPGAMHACVIYTQDDYTFRNCGELDDDVIVLYVDWSYAGYNAKTRTCDRAGDWDVYARVGYPAGPHPDHPDWIKVEYRESNHLEVTRDREPL